MAIKKQTFMKGVLMMMGAQLLIKVMGFVYRIILTNFPEFGDVGNSYYGSGYRVYMFILAIATTGIPNTISKIVSEKIAIGDSRGAHRIFKIALALFSVIGLVFSAGLFIFADSIATNMLANPGVGLTMKVLAPAVFFCAVSAVFKGYFVGMSDMSLTSKSQIIDQIVNSVGSVVFVSMLLDTRPEVMAAGSTLGTTLATAVSFAYIVMYYCRNRKDIAKEIENSPKREKARKRDIVKQILKYVVPISFGSVIVTIANMIDLMTVIQGLTKYGYVIDKANEIFGIILGKVDILISLPLSINIAFSTALVPAVSAAMAQKNKKEAKRKIKFSLKISSMIAFPCAIGLCVLATPIIKMLFPNSPEGGYLLAVASWTVVFSVIAQTAYGGLHGIGKMLVPGICLLFGVIAKYVMNVTLIPIFGETIAVLSTVIYQVVAATLAVVLLFRYLKEKMEIADMFLKPAVCAIIMGVFAKLSYEGFMFILHSNMIATILSIILAMVTYVICIFAFKTLDENEIEELPKGNKINAFIRKFKRA